MTMFVGELSDFRRRLDGVPAAPPLQKSPYFSEPGVGEAASPGTPVKKEAGSHAKKEARSHAKRAEPQQELPTSRAARRRNASVRHGDGAGHVTVKTEPGTGPPPEPREGQAGRSTGTEKRKRAGGGGDGGGGGGETPPRTPSRRSRRLQIAR